MYYNKKGEIVCVLFFIRYRECIFVVFFLCFYGSKLFIGSEKLYRGLVFFFFIGFYLGEILLLYIEFFYCVCFGFIIFL